MEKYRIIEHAGLFVVEKKCNSVSGFLWWKRKYKEWKPLSFDGFPVDGLIFKIGWYTSLEGARRAIQSLKKGVVYHDA